MLSIALLAAAASPVPPAPHAAPVCQNANPEMARVTGTAPAQRLDRLPNAKLVLTVIRSEAGCQKPVIVRDDIGAATKR